MRTVDAMVAADRARVEQNVLDARQTIDTAMRGTREALADCERRRLEAIAAAQAVKEDIEDRLDSRIPEHEDNDEHDGWGPV